MVVRVERARGSSGKLMSSRVLNFPTRRRKSLLAKGLLLVTKGDYREKLGIWYSCREFFEKPSLGPQDSTEPQSSIIKVDPKTDWPL